MYRNNTKCQENLEQKNNVHIFLSLQMNCLQDVVHMGQ